MRSIVRLVRQQFVGVIALFLVVGGVTVAATGRPVRLGLGNSASGVTTIRNDGVGPVLQLNAAPGQPPIRVNNTRVVTNLNAGFLRGKLPSDFARAGASYTKTQSDALYARVIKFGSVAIESAGFDDVVTVFEGTIDVGPGILAVYLDTTASDVWVTRAFLDNAPDPFLFTDEGAPRADAARLLPGATAVDVLVNFRSGQVGVPSSGTVNYAVVLLPAP